MGSLTELGKYLKNAELAWGTSGNLSKRLSREEMIITASGTLMDHLKEDDFVITNIFTGDSKGAKKASKETPMHSGIYQQREDANVVIHSSPFYTTLLACSDLKLYSSLFIETMYYLENITYIDYYHPGTIELGEAIKKKSKDANIIIMKNHGVVVFDESIQEARMRLETLEMACRMIVKSQEAGITLNYLPSDIVKSFLEESRYKPRKGS
ncbi:class II aldolase/adducin family protein [Oceanobacillus jeddahense]|uniref:class II aldolase/adducin family protein n=1 Tax=Oceanobacillus jeddahense TaxID=1462527 RepID=UPI000596168F|nr:class II aldolase/adducin family protein [Oceanobacillus jeddahense]